ncbi:glucosaminidase domain-containing protein [Clostridium novyi]|uniref:glucosaminidase domain-containing protein n=1 Tax=Clostridium novyi TaxID=1542 RepID=UPI000907EA1B|nr:glucosaminidase domain-containing protein [Clostridium novyi]
MSKQEEFINLIKDVAIQTQKEYKIFASVTISQAILESGWGQSELACKYNNYFGIKASGDWKEKIVLYYSNECTESGIIKVKSKFRVYDSLNESIKDHARFLLKSRYIDKGILKATNYEGQIDAIVAGGYCTAPDYKQQLISLINRYDLEKYDMKGNDNMNIIETNLNFKSLSWGNEPKQIFLHHLEWSKCTVYDVDRCHKNDFGWSGIGYHFFVAKDGNIYRGRPEGAIGAHCKGHNTNTLGIGAEGNYMNETMPQAQKNAIIQLCKYLCNKYGITDVRGHKEAPYSTDCPGVNYPLEEIKSAVKGQTVKTTSVGNLYGAIAIVSTKGGILNVRSKPGTYGDRIGSLSNGSRVKLFKDCGNGWYEIYYGAHGGYVSKDYISLI